MALSQRLPVSLMGRKVRVYRNLQRGGYSVQLRQPGHKYDRRVIAHSDSIMLQSVRFVVSEAGRLRVIREQRKNVHAFAEGLWAGRGWYDRSTLGLSPVVYNPYQSGNFRLKYGDVALEGAEHVLLDSEGVAVRGFRRVAS